MLPFQVSQERIETLMRQIQELESKNTSLQLTVDRLSNALAKSTEDENQLKDKVSTLKWGSIVHMHVLTMIGEVHV